MQQIVCFRRLWLEPQHGQSRKENELFLIGMSRSQFQNGAGAIRLSQLVTLFLSR